MKEKQDFIRQYRENQLKFSRFYADVLSKADLTLPQYALLVQLTGFDRAAMTDLSRRLHISKPAITNLVDRLEEKRLLKRLPHPTDRRVSLIGLEPKGARLVESVQKHILEILLETLDAFGQKEREIITRFYGALAMTLDEALKRKKNKK